MATTKFEPTFELLYKCIKALELHHVDASEKEFTISTLVSNCRSWYTIYEELKKCILLCSNCHREVHENITQIPESYKKFDEKEADLLRSASSLRYSGTRVLSEHDQENLHIKIKHQAVIKKRRDLIKIQVDKSIAREEKLKQFNENRKQTILDSDIDFTKFGWGIKLALKLNMSAAALVRWMTVHMPEFYENNCFKTKRKLLTSLKL